MCAERFKTSGDFYVEVDVLCQNFRNTPRTQLHTTCYDHYLEWVDPKELSDERFFAEGGLALVAFAFNFNVSSSTKTIQT